jgi:hypothetical protein
LRWEPRNEAGGGLCLPARAVDEPHGRGAGLQPPRYDNRADPAAHTDYEGSPDVFAWRTAFWSAGARTDTGPVTWIAQAMDGSTEIDPTPGVNRTTRFRSAFLLAGWNRGVRLIY